MTVLALVGLGALLLAAERPANAHDHRPPWAETLTADSQVQRGKPGSSCWVSPTPEGHVQYCGSKELSFPRRIVAPRQGMTLKLDTCFLPVEVSFDWWQRLGKHGNPRGHSKEVDVDFLPQSDGENCWISAVFDRPRKAEFGLLFGRWTDADGSTMEQTASWSFHLSTSMR